MKFLTALSLAVALAGTALAGTVTLTFDEPALQGTGSGGVNVGAFYSGEPASPTFSGAYTLTAPNYNVAAYPYHSSPDVIYTLSESLGQIDIDFSAPVSNVSMWYTGSFQVSLYGSSSLTPINTVSLSAAYFTNSFASVAGTGVIEVVIAGSPETYTLDDVSYDVPTSTPEPATLSLMAAGLAIAGLVRRGRKA